MDMMYVLGFMGLTEQRLSGEGVNFTVCSLEATAVELLLYHRGEKEPYAILPFPKHYRIGSVYSMIVFDLDICDFEYAYRVDGPCIPEKGLILIKRSRFWILMQERSPVRAYGANSLIRIMNIRRGWWSMTLTGKSRGSDQTHSGSDHL